VWRLVRGPAELTLLVTLLRLAGEHLGWSPALFSTQPGGGLAPVGITWLVPVVGFYLGWRLHGLGCAPRSTTRALAWPLAALVALPALAVAIDRLQPTTWTSAVVLWGTCSLAAAAVAVAAWPALGRLLFAYAALARVPVALVMALAIAAGLGTHYDAPPPGFPAMAPAARWLWTGLVPQCTIWLGFTVAVGAPFGTVGFVARSRRAR
jgi:hypothetical protein